MEVTGALPLQQPRWLRKRKVVLYYKELIIGETSLEGGVDEDLRLSKKRKGSVRLKMKSKKLIRNLRSSRESVTPESTDSDPEFMPGGYDTASEIVEIDETTPRRSARCCKLSQKIIQIKKERQEGINRQEDAAKLVKKGRRYPQIAINTISNETDRGLREIPDGLRRSARTSKPTEEILKFRKELEEDNTGVIRRDSYPYKSNKKFNLSQCQYGKSGSTEEVSSLNSFKRRVSCSSSNAELVFHPTSPRKSPPVRRKVSSPPGGEVATPRQARNLCTQMLNIPPASEHVPAVQVRPLEELLFPTSYEDAETARPPFPKDTTEDPISPKKKKFVDLSEGGSDNEDYQLSQPKPVQDIRDWNCFQCVYELTKMDARLTMTDLDPLLEKMVDGDALMKSSLSDLVNVVGLQYSPAVRVVFLVQKMTEDASGEDWKNPPSLSCFNH